MLELRSIGFELIAMLVTILTMYLLFNINNLK